MKKVLLVAMLSGALGTSVVAQDMLGSVTLGRPVIADGRPLAAGAYQVRLTSQQAQPSAAGQSPQLERWVEFVQDGQVKGREVASIVPDADIDEVADGPRPGPNASRVDLLRGNEYVRVWINRDGNHYLLHLPVGG